MAFTDFLVSMSRMTRGQNSREVTFLGIPTEEQKIGEDGKPEFTNPRAAKPGEKQKEPEPVMVPVPVEKLPTADELIKAIVAVLKNVDHDIRLALARLYNVTVFSQEVENTAAVVVDGLTPVFVELGITDEGIQTKLRRSVTAQYNSYRDMGKIDKNNSPEREAEIKGKLLKRQFEELASL